MPGDSKEKKDKILKISRDNIIGRKRKKAKPDVDKAKAFLEKLKAKRQQRETAEQSPETEKENDILQQEEKKPEKTTKKTKTQAKTKKTKESKKTEVEEKQEEIQKETPEKQQEKQLPQPAKESTEFETYAIKDGRPVKSKEEEILEQIEKKKEREKEIEKTKKQEESKTTQESVSKTQKEKREEPKAPPKPQYVKQEGVEYQKIKVTGVLTVRDLAEKLNVKPVDLIKKLMSMGIFASITQKLDEEVAAIVSLDYGYELEFAPDSITESIAVDEEEQDDPSKLKPRPPIITIMGHVDHGKTTLLDALRESNVVATEAGQITQHIGAYMVRTPKGNITVLDTPGHEAFTAMRAQGVKITDIVILVVSAVDGVMPQTVEAINHAKAANVPIIVAINKIDLPQANPDNVKQQLSAHNLIPEDWGGNTPMVEISAKKRINLDKLLEIVLLQAEIMELKANPDKKGKAVIIEAKKDSKRGILATIVCLNGRIKQGDAFIVGTSYGKVRSLIDDRGQRLKELLPAMPAELMGIADEIPVPGDVLKVVNSEKEARKIVEERKQKRKDNLLHQKNISLLSLRSQIEQKLIKKLNIILKADVYGSLQAIRDSLEKFSNPEVAIHILHTGIGDIAESDLMLAKASNAIIFGFNVNHPEDLKEKAKHLGVEVRIYRIIYELFEDVKAAINGMLEPEIVDINIGKAIIKQVFDLSSGKIAGSMVLEGKVQRGAIARIMRDNQLLTTTKIATLKRFKEDVREVEKGYECGITFEGFKDFKENDIIDCYIQEERTRRIDEFQK